VDVSVTGSVPVGDGDGKGVKVGGTMSVGAGDIVGVSVGDGVSVAVGVLVGGRRVAVIVAAGISAVAGIAD